MSINSVLKKNFTRRGKDVSVTIPAGSPAGSGTGSSGSRFKLRRDDKMAEANARDFLKNGSAEFDTAGKRGTAVGGWAKGNTQVALKKEGFSGVLGALAHDGIRGAVGGAALGGTMEAAQGGSFWEGAKTGAFNGAVGWAGYRAGMRATGATSYNPFSKQGALKQGYAMYGSTARDPKISKPALKILNLNHQDGLTRSYMNNRKPIQTKTTRSI